jgi:hypothetical protein
MWWMGRPSASLPAQAIIRVFRPAMTGTPLDFECTDFSQQMSEARQLIGR